MGVKVDNCNKINEKRFYLVKLADFLASNGMIMEGQELVEHLNRNNFLTSYGTKYAGGRGIYKLLGETYKWLDKLRLVKECENFAKAFVKGDGKYPWE